MSNETNFSNEWYRRPGPLFFFLQEHQNATRDEIDDAIKQIEEFNSHFCTIREACEKERQQRDRQQYSFYHSSQQSFSTPEGELCGMIKPIFGLPEKK